MSGGGGGGCGGGSKAPAQQQAQVQRQAHNGASAEPTEPEWLPETTQGKLREKRALADALRAEAQP
jgi:hypothetical protein